MTDSPIGRAFALEVLWLAALLAGGVPAAAGAQESLPIKLGVRPETEVLDEGSTARVVVELQDARSRPTGAKGSLPVDVDIVLPSGVVRTEQLIFAPGESSQELRVDLPEPGLVKLIGRQRQLLEGSAAILVREPPAARAPAGPPRTAAAMSRAPSTGRVSPHASGGRVAGAPAGVLGGVLADVHRSVDLGAHDRVAADAPEPPAAPLVLSLYLSSGRPLLADGNDAATVETFVREPAGGAPANTKVWLRAQGAEMDPIPLELEAGASHGRIQLTSREIGDVSVSLEDVEPEARVDGERQFAIRFVPPITWMSLTASPPSASMFDSVDLVVELRDATGRPVATDVPRQVSLTLESGEADLDPAALTIDAGRTSARAELHPRSRTPIVVVASSPQLMDQKVELPVRLLSLWLALLLVGGAAGGWAAHQRSARKSWLPYREMLVGLLAGPALYWLASSLRIPGVPESAVKSLFGMAIIALVGGYLGTEVFEIARRAVSGKKDSP